MPQEKLAGRFSLSAVCRLPGGIGIALLNVFCLSSPNNALALGDALAVVLLKRKKFDAAVLVMAADGSRLAVKTSKQAAELAKRWADED